jgi:hypothetical protein
LIKDKNSGTAQPKPRSAFCGTAEKKTYLARRRGGGTTARANEQNRFPLIMKHHYDG